jgi:hypothetical protein
MEQISACYTQNNTNTSTDWTRQLSPTDNLTVAPNEITLRREQEPDVAHPHTKDVYRTRNKVGKTAQPTIQSQRQTIASQQDHACAQPSRKPQRAVQPAQGFLHDGSTPYVPGHGARRESELQHLTDAMTAAVERPSFECDECGKKYKDKAGLK